MRVKLIGMTAGIDGHGSAEDLIVYMARVSNPSNQQSTTGKDKLIGYLIRNEHWSPFEMVSVVIEINTTRDIARQILRHRSFSFQEFSQRYADPTTELTFGLRSARKQDPKNRQNSIELDGTLGNALLGDEWIQKQQELIAHSLETYQWAIGKGIAKEQARAVLPEGNTHSKMYMNGTLRSWIHYCQLRMSNGTQKEHAEIASACWNIIGQKFPNVVKALDSSK